MPRTKRMTETRSLDAVLAEWFYRNGSTALVVTDRDGVIQECNPAFASICRRRSKLLKGTPMLDALHQPGKSQLVAAYREVLTTGSASAVIAVADGDCGPGQEPSDRQWRFRLEHDRDSDLVLCRGSDLTRERHLSSEVKTRTVRDRLTGLENRDAFVDELQTVLGTGQSVALFIIDVDRFAAVNDTYGHELGDAVLIVLGRRIRRMVGVRETVARIGGDQFAVMVRRLDGREQAEDIARRLHENLSDRIVIADTSVHLRISIGLSYADSGDKDASTVLREADTALAKAADLGGNRIQWFEPEFHAQIQRRVETEVDLRMAVGTDQLDADVQGVFTVNRRLVGFEALARWRHPTRGTVPPDLFIDVADRFGLLDHVLEAVLDRSLSTLAPWMVADRRRRLAVNVAPSQLIAGRPTELIAAAIHRHGIRADQLVVEVTERELVAEPEAIRTLREITELGSRIAIDDFGAGASSLGYLWTLPVSVLKLDRSLVQSMMTDLKAALVVASIADLGRQLGLSIVAEGVETEDELAQLAELGLRRMQGYLLHRPSRLSDIDDLLDDNEISRPSG